MSSPLDRAAVAVSRTARGGLVWVALAAVAARRGRDGAVVVDVAAAALTADALALGASYLIGSRRPCLDEPSLIPCPSSPSLPSNHAASAFAATATLARHVAKSPLLDAAAATVAASRVHVGVHRTRDVVAGAVLGEAVAAAVARIRSHTRRFSTDP